MVRRIVLDHFSNEIGQDQSIMDLPCLIRVSLEEVVLFKYLSRMAKICSLLNRLYRCDMFNGFRVNAASMQENTETREFGFDL